MTREEELFKKRLLDLASAADRRGIITYTDFLNLNELNIYHQAAGELSFVQSTASGGYMNAERQIIAFIPDAFSYLYPTEGTVAAADGADPAANVPFPIACVHVCPLHEKYADKLTHRDYLGAVLNLGIDRSMTGDILVDGTSAWIYCLERMADFLCEELTRVKHTEMRGVAVSPGNVDFQPKYELVRGSVASVRLDALLSLAFGSSRSSLVGLIEGGKVFVNARLVTSNGCKLKENDLISARGLGRFRYLGVSGETKKGRLIAKIEKFV